MNSLTQSDLKNYLFYDVANGIFRWKIAVARNVKAGSVAGYINPRGYVRIRINGKNYTAHRLAWLYVYGSWPVALIDHINGIKTDNQIGNLRDVDSATNIQNQKHAHRRNKHSGVLGVYPTTAGKWRSRIQAYGKRINIGTFNTLTEAQKAYIDHKRIVHKGVDSHEQ